MNTLTDEQMEKIAGVMFDAAFSAWSMNIKLNEEDLRDDFYAPQIGDYAFETTNPFVPRLLAIGKILDIIKGEHAFKTYLIERLDGKIQRWENAHFVKVADDKTIKLLER